MVKATEVFQKPTTPVTPITPQNFRYPHPYFSQSSAQEALTTLRGKPGWVIPDGYADYSTVTPGSDGHFYIDVNITRSLHSPTECNSYLMAVTG